MRRMSMVVALSGVALGIASLPSAAADLRPMPVKAPVLAVAPVFSWSGCYIGAHAGYASAHKDWNWAAFPTTNGNHDATGGLVGGQIGCNFQRERVVFGIEGQISWADLDGSHTRNLTLPFVGGVNVFGFHSRVESLGTIAARLGYTFDRTLLFVKGGNAFANDKYKITVNGVDFATSTDSTRWGWMIGVGAEYGFTNNWSGKIEYNYMDFGSRRVGICAVGGGGGCDSIDITQQIHLVKAGINYRFGGPLVARY